MAAQYIVWIWLDLISQLLSRADEWASDCEAWIYELITTQVVKEQVSMMTSINYHFRFSWAIFRVLLIKGHLMELRHC